MSGLFDLLFSYVLIVAGFVVFGTLVHGWMFPNRLTGGSLTGLLVVSFALGLLGAIMVGIGLNWRRAATETESLAGPREL